jgi:hypothetical protein
MALGKCRECGVEVSTSAKVCPKCGVSKPVKKTSLIVKMLAGVLALGVLGSIVGQCTQANLQKQAEAEKARLALLSPEERAAEEKRLEEEKAAKEEQEAAAREAALSPKEKALKDVKLAKWGWEKGGFDNVMLIHATIKNEGKRDVKDFEITCIHSSKSGTEIDRNSNVVYELVKAGKSLKIQKFSMGFIHTQAASSSCEITDLVLMSESKE